MNLPEKSMPGLSSQRGNARAFSYSEDPGNSCDIAVIGSGPAGLAARYGAAECGRTCVVFEKMDRPSLKLLASGGTKCNFSNLMPPEDFMRKFGRNGAFMRNALSLTPREWIEELLHKHNVETSVVDDFYCFPASGGAKSVRNAFCSGFPAVRTFSEVKEIQTGEGEVKGIVLDDGTVFQTGKVILAGGGKAWAGLGSDSGLRLAESVGHAIVEPLPAVAPLMIAADPWVRTLSGVSLPQAVLHLVNRRGKTVAETNGNLLFTHEGLSGFAALNLSSDAAFLCRKEGSSRLLLEVLPGRSRSEWLSLLEKFRREQGGKLVRSLLAYEGIPHSLADTLCTICSCAETPACRLTGALRDTLAETLSGVPLTLSGVGPMGKAMAMRGGVSLKEIDPSTMESRLLHGLYFAGEIVDLAGPCGGYNIQWAISSGRLAGISAAKSI